MVADCAMLRPVMDRRQRQNLLDLLHSEDAEVSQQGLALLSSLRGADLSDARLPPLHYQDLDLRWAQLQGCTMVGARIERSTFYGAQLVLAMLEPVRCDGCGLDYELSVQQPSCPRCQHGRVWVIGPTRLAPPPADEAERLVTLLVSLGLLELSGPPAAVTQQLVGVEASHLSAVLLASEGVTELYASDTDLSALLALW
ncbi:MAG: hypothetical protein ACI8S6_005901 [Myxococcota bacterium]|jgi:hypothetical protein